MKKIYSGSSITVCIALGLLSGVNFRCSADTKEGPLQNALIWRISGNNLPAPSFLFGILPVLDSGEISMHSTVIEQLKRADALVFEASPAVPQYQQVKALEGKNRSQEEILMQIARSEEKMICGISTPDQHGNSFVWNDDMIQAYEKSDIERIHALISELLEDSPGVFDQLFALRNASRLPAMTSLMHDQSCFFAVGAGHLAGDSGLIRLLRKKGYKVSPVHMDFWFHD